MIGKTEEWKEKVDDYCKQTSKAYEKWREVVEKESATINTLLQGVEEEVGNITDASDSLKNTVIDSVIPAMDRQYESVRKVTEAYALQRSTIGELMGQYESLIEKIEAAMLAQDTLAQESSGGTDYDSDSDSSTTSNGSAITSPPVSNTPTISSGPTDEEKKAAAALAKEAQEIVNEVHYGRLGNKEDGWLNAAKAKYSADAVTIALKAFNDSKEGSGYSYYYEKALELAGRYNTGGYTGAWGPEGRLAILDEKELVLNKQDTENFLMATEILRNIVDLIDLNSFHSQMSWLSSARFSATSGGSVDQNVKIEAHFPSVTDKGEIEEAFNNLINTASQYANRR